jgi:hypothetical protein
MAGQLRVDEITNEAGTGSPSFPNGVAASTATTAGSITGTTTAAVPTSALASGTANNTTFLRGDRTWGTVSAETTINTLDPMLKTMLIYGTALNEPVWHYTSKTVTLAANVPHLIMVFGSGGGGGRGPISTARCHGGNGGDTALKFITPSANTNVTITIGAGGAGRNTNGNGGDGAATTVVGTGININVPGGRGGVRTTGITNLTNHFNAANADPTGADLFFKGGRTRSNQNAVFIHGSSVFGVNGTSRINAFSPGGPFVSGGPDGFVRVSGAAKNGLVNDANQIQSFNNNETNDNILNWTDRAVHKNLLSLVLPSIFEFYGPYTSITPDPNFTGLVIKPPFMPGESNFGAGNSQIRAGGRAAGGGYDEDSHSGNGGAGLVIIWSFVNG